MFYNINEIFWKRHYWLPNNCTWNQVQEYNRLDNTFYILIFVSAFVIYLIRYFFEKYIYTNIIYIHLFMVQ